MGTKRVLVEVDTNGDHVVTIRANKRQRRFVAVVAVLAVFHFTGYGIEKAVAVAKWALTLVP